MFYALDYVPNAPFTLQAVLPVVRYFTQHRTASQDAPFFLRYLGLGFIPQFILGVRELTQALPLSLTALDGRFLWCCTQSLS